MGAKRKLAVWGLLILIAALLAYGFFLVRRDLSILGVSSPVTSSGSNAVYNSPIAASISSFPLNQSSTLENDYFVNTSSSILVFDSLGRVAGKDKHTGVVYQGIPGSSYIENATSSEVRVVSPLAGQYGIAVIPDNVPDFIQVNELTSANGISLAAAQQGMYLYQGIEATYVQTYDPNHPTSTSVGTTGTIPREGVSSAMTTAMDFFKQLFLKEAQSQNALQLITSPGLFQASQSLSLHGTSGILDGYKVSYGMNTINGISLDVLPVYNIGKVYDNQVLVKDGIAPFEQTISSFQDYEFIMNCNNNGLPYCIVGIYKDGLHLSDVDVLTPTDGMITIETFSYEGIDYFYLTSAQCVSSTNCQGYSSLGSFEGDASSTFALEPINHWSEGEDNPAQPDVVVGYGNDLFVIPQEGIPIYEYGPTFRPDGNILDVLRTKASTTFSALFGE